MIEKDKQWLEKHGFKLDNELSRQLGSPIYVKRPIDTEESLLKIYIKFTGIYWEFFVRFPYKNEHVKFAHLFPILADEALDFFIDRWNCVECIKMLEKMNKEYFIPEAMKKEQS